MACTWPQSSVFWTETTFSPAKIVLLVLHWTENRWGLKQKRGECQNKAPQRDVQINTIHVSSAIAQQQHFIHKVDINSISFSAQMHSMLHLPLPIRIQWCYTLWSGRSSLFSQLDLFYFVQHLDTSSRRTQEAASLCVLQMHNHHTHKPKKKKKKNKNVTLNVSLSFPLSSWQCLLLKYKGTEKKELREIQIKNYFKFIGRLVI